MSKKSFCSICQKGRFKTTKRIKTRSKYNPTTTYFQYPNIQWLKLPNRKRIRVCTKCRKRLLKSNFEKLKI
ncbi:MAG: hypothetical protein KatS3mg094_500 [Candidatus Parcubacteria bacterium]|nr:MAG: hypothetical protein KatS3mg094_500 [Candidatus Parcubacteria bacterium]